MSTLFGVPTGISGLDQLFGGAGPILAEHPLRSNDGNAAVAPKAFIGRAADDYESDAEDTEDEATPLAVGWSSAELMQEPCLTGRLMLIRGQFGSGKSLLAVHMAASVARKGGIAHIASVEIGRAHV